MVPFLLHDTAKKARFAASFLLRRLVHVNLQLLYACNFHCRICDFWRPEYRGRPRLSAAEVGVISDKLATIGPQIVSIGGGEPLLHPELEAVVAALARHHFPVMISNGSLITPANARALFAAGMVEISVSIDYADPARHDAQRGTPGAFDKAMAALEALQASRTHPEQRVNMISVIMEDNLDEAEPLIRLCERLGITYLVTLYSDSRGAKQSRAIPSDVSRRLLELKRRHRHFVALRGYIGRFSQAVRDGGVGRCEAGRMLCNVDSQGDVSTCIDRLDRPVGNLLEDDMPGIAARLAARHAENDCRACWTSCRGSIESVRSGDDRALNALDYYEMTRPVPLRAAF